MRWANFFNYHFATVENDEISEAPKSDTPNASENPRWFESKLFILVLGSLLIPFVLSVFQHHFERTKWIAQSRYDAQRAKASAMRDFLRELATVEADIRTQELIAIRFQSAADPEARTLLYRQFAEGTLTFNQHDGKAEGSLSIFADRTTLRPAFDAYNAKAAEIVREASALMDSPKASSGNPDVISDYPSSKDPIRRLISDATELSQRQYVAVSAQALKALEEIEISLEK